MSKFIIEWNVGAGEMGLGVKIKGEKLFRGLK